jgi:hypothetical protein
MADRPGGSPDAVWFAGVPAPATRTGVDGVRIAVHTGADGIWIAVRRPFHRLSLAEPDEFEADPPMMLTELATLSLAADRDLPAALRAVTVERDVPAADVHPSRLATMVTIDGHRHLALGWDFGEAQAVVTIYQDEWLGLLAPGTDFPLRLDRVRR